VAEGATVLYPVVDVGGGIRVATIIDPWGNAVGLIEET
jgi:predicted enzyme related to lactoylglutathione lyase